MRIRLLKSEIQLEKSISVDYCLPITSSSRIFDFCTGTILDSCINLCDSAAGLQTVSVNEEKEEEEEEEEENVEWW